MNTSNISSRISRRPGALDLLKAAVAELDAIVADGLACDAADRLSVMIGLIEEALGELEVVTS